MSNPQPRPIRLEDLDAIKTVSDVQLSPDGTRVAYVLSEVDAAADDYRTTIWMVPTAGGEPAQFTYGPRHDTAPRWSPDGRLLCFLSDRAAEGAKAGEGLQLYVVPVDGGEARKLTALDPGAGPAAWSPNGTCLLFAAEVFTEPSPQTAHAREVWASRPRHVTRAQYKGDGAGYTFDRRSHLFLTQVESGATTQLTHGDSNEYELVWSPDGRQIAFSRPRNGAADYAVSDIWVADVDMQSLHNERQVTTTVGRAGNPAWSPNGRLIACIGTDEQERGFGDFHGRLWLVPADGGLAQCLTAAYDRSMTMMAAGCGPFWATDGTTITCLSANAGNDGAVRITVVGGTVEPVTGGGRTLTSMSARPNAGRIAFIASRWDNPGDVYVCNWDGSDERQLTHVNADWLSQVILPRVERRTFNSPHGATLDGWVMHPVSGAYPAPLLVDIHGGPSSYYGDGFPKASFFRYVLASQGWAVLYINPSGSGSYSKAFMQSLRGRWGEYDLAEQLAAVDTLCAEGVADRDHLAVTGYSYGGYMTAWTIGHTGRYKSAVVGAPVINLESFHGTSDIGMWFTQWYMQRDVATQREAYRRLSPVNYVDQVTTPTLIVHGEADDRCPIGQGEEFYIGLVAAGKVPTEMVRYPGSSHGFIINGRPSHRADFNWRVVEWLRHYTLR